MGDGYVRRTSHDGGHSVCVGRSLQGGRDEADVQNSPASRLEQGLHPWVSFGIVPLFALVNAGISLHGLHRDTVLHPIFLGVVLGLMLGKPLGITLFS